MTRPHPELWYPIAALLSALRKLLRATSPDAFAAIALEARAQLAVAAALIRRYIHILAAELVLPPPRPAPPRPPADNASARGEGRYLFPLIEQPSASRSAGPGEADPPELQWALLMDSARRLAEVLASPAAHARRLARRFGTMLTAGLRDMAVPWHIIRRIPPALDTLLLHIDQLARPQAWAGMDTS